MQDDRLATSGVGGSVSWSEYNNHSESSQDVEVMSMTFELTDRDLDHDLVVATFVLDNEEVDVLEQATQPSAVVAARRKQGALTFRRIASLV